MEVRSPEEVLYFYGLKSQPSEGAFGESWFLSFGEAPRCEVSKFPHCKNPRSAGSTGF